MEFQKIVNFLDVTSDNKDLPKFVTKKWIEVYDQSEKNYNPNKEIRINCISKINGIKIDNAEDLDVVMPMYDLLEYSKNYKKTGSLWNYYRDEPNSATDDNEINYSIINTKSFDYKTNFYGKWCDTK